MNIINEQIITEIKEEHGVIVVGGGIAGISAALSASRTGADVLLIEREYILGGLGTAGLVTIYLPLCDGMGNQISFGIAEELLKLSVKHGAEKDYPDAWLYGEDMEKRKKQRYLVRYNPHLFALSAEKLLRDNGVNILYGTTVCAVHKENDKINAVIVENKSGRYGIGVKSSVVDCSGDADIVHLSGESTSLFKQGNILAAWHYYVSSEKYDLKMLGFCDVPDKDKTDKEIPLLSNRRFGGIDGKELSEMTEISHMQIYNDILKSKEADSSYLPVTLPTIPQIRMTRRLDGEYVMDDMEMHKSFSDSVGRFSDWRKKGPAYDLPFSTLHGKKVKNLICAGRCISVTDAMWDITRVIPVCAVTGQAAGTAAAMFDDFTTADVTALQEKLVADGVVIH